MITLPQHSLAELCRYRISEALSLCRFCPRSGRFKFHQRIIDSALRNVLDERSIDGHRDFGLPGERNRFIEEELSHKWLLHRVRQLRHILTRHGDEPQNVRTSL